MMAPGHCRHSVSHWQFFKQNGIGKAKKTILLVIPFSEPAKVNLIGNVGFLSIATKTFISQVDCYFYSVLFLVWFHDGNSLHKFTYKYKVIIAYDVTSDVKLKKLFNKCHFEFVFVFVTLVSIGKF